MNNFITQSVSDCLSVYFFLFLHRSDLLIYTRSTLRFLNIEKTTKFLWVFSGNISTLADCLVCNNERSQIDHCVNGKILYNRFVSTSVFQDYRLPAMLEQ